MGNRISSSRWWPSRQNSFPPPQQPLPKSLAGCVEACRDGVVVLAGCGGGCDVYGTALLLHHLRGVAQQVILINLTFTSEELLETYGQRVTPHLHRIEPGVYFSPTTSEQQQETNHDPYYFPEALFANAVHQPVYALSRHATVRQIVRAYGQLHPSCPLLRAISLTDGGCDVLLTGDETGLGTPAEDMLHLRAVADVPAQHKAIVSVGANVDCGHGVVPGELDQRLETLQNNTGGGAVLFREFLSLDRDDAAYYHRVVSKCLPAWTVTHSLVKAAIEGHRGTYTENVDFEKSGRSIVPITDLTATLYGFHLKAVASQVRYLSSLKPSSDMLSVCQAVQAHRSQRALNGLSQHYKQDDTRTDNDGGYLQGGATPPPPPPRPTAISWIVWLRGGQEQQRCASAKEVLASL